MEQQQRSSSLSWRWDNRSHTSHSQRFNSTITEMDDKIKRIIHLIADDGDTFAQRAEMYYNKRPEIIRMLQDLQGSYHVFADALKSESFCKTGSGSSSFRKVTRTHPDIIVKNSLQMTEESSVSSNYEFVRSENLQPVVDASLEKKFSRLLEENLSQQAELIKRNEEKREVIHDLRKENKVLRQHSGVESKKSTESESEGRGGRRSRFLFASPVLDKCFLCKYTISNLCLLDHPIKAHLIRSGPNSLTFV